FEPGPYGWVLVAPALASLLSSAGASALAEAVFFAGAGAGASASAAAWLSLTVAAPSAERAATKASNAALVKTTSSASSTSYVLSWSKVSSATFWALRRLLTVSSSPRSTTTRTRGRAVSSRSAASAALVDGASPLTSDSTTWSRPLRARSVRAPRSAAAFIFLGVRWSYERGVGPWTMPPPAYCGARIEPWRARPVPFWRYGFLPPPRTSPRDLTSCVP